MCQSHQIGGGEKGTFVLEKHDAPVKRLDRKGKHQEILWPTTTNGPVRSEKGVACSKIGGGKNKPDAGPTVTRGGDPRDKEPFSNRLRVGEGRPTVVRRVGGGNQGISRRKKTPRTENQGVGPGVSCGKGRKGGVEAGALGWPEKS